MQAALKIAEKLPRLFADTSGDLGLPCISFANAIPQEKGGSRFILRRPRFSSASHTAISRNEPRTCNFGVLRGNSGRYTILLKRER